MSAAAHPDNKFDVVVKASRFANMPIKSVATEDVEPATQKKLDDAAEEVGFSSRDTVTRIRRKRTVEPTTNLNMRPTVSTFNAFALFCEKNGRKSYQEGLQELLHLAGVDAEGNLARR